MPTLSEALEAEIAGLESRLARLRQAKTLLTDARPQAASKARKVVAAKGPKMRPQILAILAAANGKPVRTADIKAKVAGASGQYVGQTILRAGGYKSSPDGWVPAKAKKAAKKA